jgi:xanthine dehydrogenase accessory factor
VRPADVLAAHGVASNDVRDGVQFAINACPSQGAMDIFVEPFLPRPHLVIFGASPVACALAELAARMGFFVTAAAPRAEHEKLGAAQRLVDGFTLPGHDSKPRHAVVATQGSGDLAALAAALESQAGSVAFVGSRRKATVLKAKLAAQGHVAARVDVIQAPAGLDIGAITPDEIALSIVAALIVEQRHGQRLGGRI